MGKKGERNVGKGLNYDGYKISRGDRGVKMNDNLILSICISTYNRAIRVERMVKQLLANKNKRFDVCVVDDCSEDDTIERLSRISDSRLTVFKNEVNLGAKLNWYETLMHGQGKFLLHVLDRDWVNCAFLDKVIEILEEDEAGFGYIGNHTSVTSNGKNDEVVVTYKCGEEALCEYAFTPVHPTGFLVKKDCWDKVDSKKYYFENNEYGIYPHSYIYALLANDEHGISIKYNMFKMSGVSNMGRVLSHFYDKNNMSQWWTSEARKYEMCAAIKFITNFLKVDVELKRKLLLYRFKESIQGATLIYRGKSKNIENCRHYNCPVKYISYEELDKINRDIAQTFIEYLRKYDDTICDEKMLCSISSIESENREKIYENSDPYRTILDKEIQITKFQRYYLLMDAWVQLYQKGISVYNQLEQYGINNIAIYGNGQFGKRLYEAGKKSSIEIKYYIDQNAEKMLEDIPVFNLKQELPIVDAIIVTVPDKYEEIQTELRKVCEYNILSLEDIVYASFEY